MFRYDRDAQGRRALPDSVRSLNLRHVSETMRKLLANLMGAVDGIDSVLADMG